MLQLLILLYYDLIHYVIRKVLRFSIKEPTDWQCMSKVFFCTLSLIVCVCGRERAPYSRRGCKYEVTSDFLDLPTLTNLFISRLELHDGVTF